MSAKRKPAPLRAAVPNAHVTEYLVPLNATTPERNRESRSNIVADTPVLVAAEALQPRDVPDRAPSEPPTPLEHALARSNIVVTGEPGTVGA